MYLSGLVNEVAMHIERATTIAAGLHGAACHFLVQSHSFEFLRSTFLRLFFLREDLLLCSGANGVGTATGAGRKCRLVKVQRALLGR